MVKLKVNFFSADGSGLVVPGTRAQRLVMVVAEMVRRLRLLRNHLVCGKLDPPAGMAGLRRQVWVLSSPVREWVTNNLVQFMTTEKVSKNEKKVKQKFVFLNNLTFLKI